MTADPKLIAKRLRDARKQVTDETVVLNEQLALTDVIIDEYDDLIIKLDTKVQPYFPPINRKIKAVQDAYLDRVSHGCRSDLTWTLKEEQQMNLYNNPNQEVKVYEVTKDPSTFRFLGYYGANYYKFPKNREYGSCLLYTSDAADERSV